MNDIAIAQLLAFIWISLSYIHQLRSTDLPEFKGFITESNRIGSYLSSIYLIYLISGFIFPTICRERIFQLTIRMIGVVHKLWKMAVEVRKRRIMIPGMASRNTTPKSTNFPVMPPKKVLRILPKLREPNFVIEAEKELCPFIDGHYDAIYRFGFGLY